MLSCGHVCCQRLSWSQRKTWCQWTATRRYLANSDVRNRVTIPVCFHQTLIIDVFGMTSESNTFYVGMTTQNYHVLLFHRYTGHICRYFSSGEITRTTTLKDKGKPNGCAAKHSIKPTKFNSCLCLDGTNSSCIHIALIRRQKLTHLKWL